MAANALNEVIRTVGVPKEPVSDGACAELHGRFAKVANKCRIKQRVIEPYSEWQNRPKRRYKKYSVGFGERCYVPGLQSNFWTIAANGFRLSSGSQPMTSLRCTTGFHAKLLRATPPTSPNTRSLTGTNTFGTMTQQYSFQMTRESSDAGSVSLKTLEAR